MRVRRALAAVTLLWAGACGGEGSDSAESPSATTSANPAAPTTTGPAATATTAPRPTTAPSPEGVETYSVPVGHTNDPVVYPQTPPVGGIHHPGWQKCGFYDGPVPSELAVHSLEHGAIWITYRPDLAADQKAALSQLAASRGGVLVSQWDEGLPAPVVASSWGRQMKLESATDPRLRQFITAFSGDAPEPLGSCE